MKLLFLLLPVCAVAIGALNGQPQKRHVEISAEMRNKLQEVWGVDPEKRGAKLERIGKKAAAQRHHRAPINTSKKEEIPSVKIEKPFENIPMDISEINSQLGLGKYLFQGDLHLTEMQLSEVERQMDENKRSKRQAWTPATRWINNTVYFYFGDGVSDEVKTSVRTGHQYIQSHTCINFVENSTATNRIRVYNGGGCSSALGMVGGEQSLSLGDACKVVGVTAHEFIHALGFIHTQSRSDRDSYVIVDKENIDKDHKRDYAKLSFARNTLYTPYEYGSMMHYAANLNAKVKDTVVMTPTDIRYLTTMGNMQISFYDIQMINEFYECAKCPAQNAPQCKNGGYPNPRDCSKCNCPAGYGGNLCDQRPSGCGATLRATSEWQNKVIEVGDEHNFMSIRNDYTTCNHWITAPQGKKIEVRIHEMSNSGCDYGCPYNGIEIKTETDTKIRSPLICCDQFIRNQTFTSAVNPTPVVSFNRYFISSFNISYRYVDGSSAQPTTHSTTTIATTTREKPSCFDIWSDYCPQYIQTVGSCVGLDPVLAKDYCRLSCGYCGDTPTTTENSSCYDKSADYCERYIKPEGRCADLGEKAAKEHCAKTCGFCS